MSAWIGIVTAPWRVAVVILAVVDSPGRKLSGGCSSVTTTLKSLASSVAMVCCEVETPVERTTALLPISVTLPAKVRLGMASMLTCAGWPILMFTMSVSSTFTSAVMTDMLAIVIRVLPGEFWMPMTTVSPSRTGRFVTRPS